MVHTFHNRAIADHVSSDLPHKLSAENVFLTIGGTQAIDIIIPSIARHGVNILLPKPGYPQYELRASRCDLEVRHFDLLPERGWEVDLDSLESVADENTVALVLINPGAPCGNVFAYEHLKRVSLPQALKFIWVEKKQHEVIFHDSCRLQRLQANLESLSFLMKSMPM